MAAATLDKGFIISIGAVVAGCRCEEGPACTDEVSVALQMRSVQPIPSGRGRRKNATLSSPRAPLRSHPSIVKRSRLRVRRHELTQGYHFRCNGGLDGRLSVRGE